MRLLLFIILLVALGAGGIFIQQEYIPTGGDDGNTISQETISLTIKGKNITVEVADTPEERRKGLSGRTELNKNRGMLFVFQEPMRAGMWMKGMNFSIDILWFDEGKRVIDIKKNATPESYPEGFLPAEFATYVVEVNAGFANTYGITVGDQAVW